MASRKVGGVKPVVQAKRIKARTGSKPAPARRMNPVAPAASNAAAAPSVVKYPESAFQPWPGRLGQNMRQKLDRVAARRGYGPAVKLVCLLVLFGTTVFWSYLSARLTLANADQFIDAYLFEDWKTFNEAVFPGTHTFLFKWPVFALMALLGNSLGVFIGTTIAMTLLTVGGLAYLLHRIEPRPLIFGWLCLAMASVLLLVPAEPYSGALLPANFAMTTTRNLEYLLLLAGMYCILRAQRLRSYWMVAGTVLLTVLIASDKLFLPLAIGGAVVAILVFALRRRELLWLGGGYFLVASVIAALAGSLLLTVLNASGLTHIAREASSSPFALVTDIHQVANGLLYAVASLLTNFGANPVHDIVIAADMPRAFGSRLLQSASLVYLANLTVLLAAVWAVVQIGLQPLRDVASRLTVLLAGASVTAIGIFIVTDHYYPVDSRYLAIVFFTLFIGLATYLRHRTFNRISGLVVVVWALAVVPLAAYSAWGHYQRDDQALAGRNDTTRQIAQTLEGLGIRTLAGDYWYITPVKAHSNVPLTIVPIERCSHPREVLNSGAWIAPERLRQPAVYLAVPDSGDGKTYGGCTISAISGHFGIPSNITPLPGNPNILLLVYGQGLQPPAIEGVRNFSAAEPAYPILHPLRTVSKCKNGTTLNIVAHQDDDLLFMSPDLLRDIDARRCIRTVFITAGDAGQDFRYWNNREQGSMAAYAQMYGVQNSWRQSYETVAGQRVSVQYLAGVPELALVFMRLPDGAIPGHGFEEAGRQSLKRLYDGEMRSLESVDGKARYTEQGLIASLVAFMQTDKPDAIHTQDDSADNRAEDHSDHRLAGYFTKLAHSRYHRQHNLKTYLGYTQRFQPINLSEEDIVRKQTAFFTYGEHDPSVCRSVDECAISETYGLYLQRQYIVDTIKRRR